MEKFLVVIDPLTKSIEKVPFADNVVQLDDMYSSLECDMVERIRLNSFIDLWIDEEGMINGAADRVGFFNLSENQFVGKGMICGFSFEEGDSVPMSEEVADFVIENIELQF